MYGEWGDSVKSWRFIGDLQVQQMALNSMWKFDTCILHFCPLVVKSIAYNYNKIYIRYVNVISILKSVINGFQKHFRYKIDLFVFIIIIKKKIKGTISKWFILILFYQKFIIGEFPIIKYFVETVMRLYSLLAYIK